MEQVIDTMKQYLPTLFVSSLVLVGCGGAVGGGGASARISATPNPAPYGAPVSIEWDTTRGLNVVDSNFGLDAGDLSGSIEDNPGVTTTYSFTALVQNEGHDPFEISKSVTVQVTKSNKTALIIGNAAVSGPNQVRDSLMSLTTGTVTVSGTLPSSLAQDIVVIHSSAAVSPSDVSRVQGYLSAGKGVILIGQAVINLSGGNVSSVGGMLAGATHESTDNEESFRSGSGFVPLSSRYYGFRLAPAIFNPFKGLVGVSSSADRIVGRDSVTSAFAYTVPGGGKTGYVAYDGVGSDQLSAGYNLALRVIARWCMDGS